MIFYNRKAVNEDPYVKYTQSGRRKCHRKMELFAGILEKEQPEVMAFQEVNQTMAEPFINEKEVCGYQPVKGFEGKMRRDNYGASLAEALRKKVFPTTGPGSL